MMKSSKNKCNNRAFNDLKWLASDPTQWDRAEGKYLYSHLVIILTTNWGSCQYWTDRPSMSWHESQDCCIKAINNKNRHLVIGAGWIIKTVLGLTMTGWRSTPYMSSHLTFSRYLFSAWALLRPASLAWAASTLASMSSVCEARNLNSDT